jgi:hypothetical protein
MGGYGTLTFFIQFSLSFALGIIRAYMVTVRHLMGMSGTHLSTRDILIQSGLFT